MSCSCARLGYLLLSLYGRRSNTGDGNRRTREVRVRAPKSIKSTGERRGARGEEIKCFAAANFGNFLVRGEDETRGARVIWDTRVKKKNVHAIIERIRSYVDPDKEIHPHTHTHKLAYHRCIDSETVHRQNSTLTSWKLKIKTRRVTFIVADLIYNFQRVRKIIYNVQRNLLLYTVFTRVKNIIDLVDRKKRVVHIWKVRRLIKYLYVRYFENLNFKYPNFPYRNGTTIGKLTPLYFRRTRRCPSFFPRRSIGEKKSRYFWRRLLFADLCAPHEKQR